mmetsp:Transcript_19371/g.20096  ORF Transcript_19371/g.20096 Transcript_19371/m.20096 type:complete len:352 (-) Transcript_19371:37-1092(-)
MERLRAFFGNYFVARGIRAARVGILAFTIYGAGYRSGITDFIEDPEDMKDNLLKTVISQSGSSSILDPELSESKRIRVIGKRIIEAAQLYCKEKYEIELEKEKEKKGSNIEELEKWKSACKRLKGEWTVNYIDSQVPNAFVSNILPRNIFVHEGLLKYIKPTDEELALILSHEVSHLIHNHSHNLSILKGFLAAVQLISFVFVDPTGGLGFYLFDFVFSKLENYYYASFSRELEVEADHTGIQIAAKACFETRGAGGVFLKFAEYRGVDGKTISWTDSHPADVDREAYLRQASETHNPENHPTHCQEIQSYLKLFKQKAIEAARDANEQHTTLPTTSSTPTTPITTTPTSK